MSANKVFNKEFLREICSAGFYGGKHYRRADGFWMALTKGLVINEDTTLLEIVNAEISDPEYYHREKFGFGGLTKILESDDRDSNFTIVTESPHDFITGEPVLIINGKDSSHINLFGAYLNNPNSYLRDDQKYYILDSDPNGSRFKISYTPGGEAIKFDAFSSTHNQLYVVRPPIFNIDAISGAVQGVIPESPVCIAGGESGIEYDAIVFMANTFNWNKHKARVILDPDGSRYLITDLANNFYDIQRSDNSNYFVFSTLDGSLDPLLLPRIEIFSDNTELDILNNLFVVGGAAVGGTGIDNRVDVNVVNSTGSELINFLDQGNGDFYILNQTGSWMFALVFDETQSIPPKRLQQIITSMSLGVQ